MKKKFVVCFLVAVLAVLSLTVLASCDLESLLNGGNKQDDGVAPFISKVSVMKDAEGYEDSFEYKYNSRGTAPLALGFSEGYFIIIEYQNESKYPISSVTINGKKYTPSQFGEQSTKDVTYIRFSSDDLTEYTTYEYIVNNVLYTTSSATTKMTWGENVEHSVKVAYRPNFTLTLNYMNADKRLGGSDGTEDKVKSGVYYKEEMANYIVSPDYNGETLVPTKAGGWVFSGWYTDPRGPEGGEYSKLIKSTDTFDFWGDVTLYAYYERMYNYEIVSLENKITHEYVSALGSTAQKEFTSGVVLTNRTFAKGNDDVTHNTILEIPDTIFIEKISVSEKPRNDGMPSFTVNITGTEYPVVKLDKEIFRGFNTIITATVGKYVEEIAYGAFNKCNKMETLTFNSGSTLKYIGDYAFETTTKLGSMTAFTLPTTVEYLGMCAFRYSGWGITRNKNVNESVLYIPETWKYIGYKCFADTNFKRVVFKAGCSFDSQIDNEEGLADESKEGSRTIRKNVNRIGASLFSQCYYLNSVIFENTEGKSDALNIIPDFCFDAGSWWNNPDNKKGTFACISNVSFGEGIRFIGFRAFNYQVKIPQLALPKSLKEVGQYAFYNCVAVTNLNFEHITLDDIEKAGSVSQALTNDSQLEILRSYAFANLSGIDSVYITSSVFRAYGNGPFQGCTRLKCIIFNNIEEDYETGTGKIPTGFKSSNAKFGYDPKVDDVDDDEVLPGHRQSDLTYGTAESGDKESGQDKFSKTYSNPVRIFCKLQFTEQLKKDLLLGKELTAGSVSSGTKSYNSTVFVHPLENMYNYSYTVGGTKYNVTIAVQEIYKANSGHPSTTKVGYSLVYWDARTKEIVLPTATDISLSGGEIKEIAAYAIPTSCTYLKVPGCYTRFEHDALNSCSSLTTVEFEDIDTLEYIGQYAFFGTGITSFTGGIKLKVIGNNAFNRCTNLVWVDLLNTAITNKFNGRMGNYSQYKYEFELDDYDEDYNNCLGNSAFADCTALRWIYLPQRIAQIRTSTFNNCTSLQTVIIPATSISKDTSASSDDCFYEYGQWVTIYPSGKVQDITIYVDSTQTETHEAIMESKYIKGGTYQLVETAPAHP